MNEPIQTIDNIFLEAIDVSDFQSRARYLDRACDGNSEMRNRVEHLLSAASRVGTFLEQPACILTAISESGRNHVGVDPIGQMIGPYRLIRLVGEGGMGFVYLAQQEIPVKRQVAVKVIRAGMNSGQIVACFEHERQTLALMEHPNIARVLDAGATADGQPWFAMELVNGTPITLFCDQQQLSIRERIEMFIPVCRAVQHAHQKGIIHRDLKPSNVLITQIDGHPIPKIIDFGVAKATGQIRDQTLYAESGQIIGTLEYMAPEQAEPGNVDIDTRADVYALGGLLYELFAGASPFSNGPLPMSGLVEMLRLIKEVEPTRPSARIAKSVDLSTVASNRQLDPQRLVRLIACELDWVAMKCLEKDRDRRYETANDLADDLERFLEFRPVHACPPTRLYRWKKFARRHRAALAGTATILAILTLATIISTWQAVLKSRAESKAIAGWTEADRQRMQSDDVNQFMYDVLTKVNPDEKGADARLVDVLEDASTMATSRFAGSPLQEAKVRGMLAECYSNLAMTRDAARETRLAVELLKSVLAPDDHLLLQAEVKHARALLNQELPRKAKEVLDSLVPRVHRVFEPDHAVALETDLVAASLLTKLGQIEQSQIELRMLRRAAEMGADDTTQLDILNSLMVALRSGMGQQPRGHSTLIDEIELLAREAADRSTGLWGQDSLRSLRARLTLADMMCKQGKFQASAGICEEILGTSGDHLGKQHALRIKALDVLAIDRHRLGHSSDAADLRIQAIEATRQIERNPIMLVAAICDALPFLDRGQRWAEGEALTREYLTRMENLGGGHGDFMFSAQLYIARFVSLQGRTEEAEKQFQALLAQAVEAPPVAAILARLHLFYAGHLLQQELFEQAEVHLQFAADTVTDIRFGTNVINPDDIIAEFIALYEAWGNPDQLAVYQELLKEVEGYTKADKPFR